VPLPIRCWNPLLDEEQALAEYADAIDRAQAHLACVGFDLAVLSSAGKGEQSWQALLDAQNAVCRSPESKKTFQVLAEDVADRFRGLFPNPGLFRYEPQERAISAIYNLLQKAKSDADITAIMQDIRGLIDSALEVVAKDGFQQPPNKQYDLSGIDFERLRAEFARSPYKNTTVLTLQERIQARLEQMLARLEQMLAQNPSRIDLYRRYQEIIAEYNRDKDAAEIERVFADLLRVHDLLDEEERRYVREGFTSEKELAVYDLLCKDKASIKKSEVEKIKQLARQLMATVEQRRHEMGDLRDRASAQAQMKSAIIDRLLEGMPEGFSSDDIEQRAEVIFQYVQQQMHSARVH